MVLYSIQLVPDKSRGLFATQQITAGTMILSEKPIMTLNRQDVEAEDTIARLEKRWNALSSEEQTQCLAKCYDAMGINDELSGNIAADGEMEVNYDEEKEASDGGQENGEDRDSVPLHLAVLLKYLNHQEYEGWQMSAVWLHSTLINHSCAPNASRIHDPRTYERQVRAIRDLKPGEEILVSYIDLNRPRDARAAALGFICLCTTCNGPKKEESDGRRRELAKLLEAFNDFDKRNEIGEPAQNENFEISNANADALVIRNDDYALALVLAEEFVAILQEEELVMALTMAVLITKHMAYSRYERCSFYAFEDCQLESCLDFARKALANERICQGPERIHRVEVFLQSMEEDCAVLANEAAQEEVEADK
ncbi:uncharacterized protein BCR38DRAFT_528317 [Pseudomassariella vexata]|uniref:SET domain-containing protein n=1 Tax=Pseudomassariella vexata TaxID=1141098 RepID=A0A1Y2DCE5_9PEZI|nr:uncharacterized protein BCR38DRAFT_528317 [Pseudomassariella vexata]ORY56943.1 hypothetical protein BCR38DRAFT_528317 [Pseudomassariella vexata]